jgi:hypothetical protein
VRRKTQFVDYYRATKYFSLDFVPIIVRDQSGKQGVTRPGKDSSKSLGTADTGGHHEATSISKK